MHLGSPPNDAAFRTTQASADWTCESMGIYCVYVHIYTYVYISLSLSPLSLSRSLSR